MSQLTDIGVNFQLKGGDSFASQMNQMKSSFESFSSTISSLSTDKIKGHLAKAEGHFSSMATGIKSQLHLTELAIAGFLTGKAIKGLGNWILGGSGAEVDQLKDYLRIHGATNEGLKNMADSMNDLSAKRPFDKVGAWNAGENMMSMLGGLDDPKLTDRLMKATSNLALLLDAQGNMGKAVDLATPFVAGFGAKLDATGKVALHEKFNAYVKYLTDNTQLRGPDIQNILPQVIGPYLGAGKDPAEMFAHMGMLDFLRGQSGEVLKNLFGKEGKSFGAIGAELDKQSYLADLMTDRQFFAKEAKRIREQHGERLKPGIKSEADLPKGAQQDLNEAVRNRQKDYEAQGGRLLAEGKTREYSSLMLGALNQLRHLQSLTGKSVNSIIAEHFGETAIKGIFPFLEGVAAGKDQQHISKMKAIDPSGMTEDINSKFQSLGSKYKTFDQVTGALSSDFKRILEPGAIEVFGGWQQSIEVARKKIAEMKQESQISQNIKDFIGGTRSGVLDRVYGEGMANSSKTLDDAITSFAQSLAQPGWGEAGKKLGTAVGDFVVVLGQIKEMVGAAHKYFRMLSPEEPTGPQKKPSGTPFGWGLWDFDFSKSLPGWLLRGAPATEQPAMGTLQPQGLSPDFMVPSHGRSSMIAPPDSMLSAHTPGALNGNISARFDAVNVNVSMDGDEIAKKLTPRVTEDVMGRLEAEQDRNRSNANDKPLMGN
jgi:hypothetical protein